MRTSFLRRVTSYDEMWKQIDYRTLEIPETFNMGVACVDDHDPNSRALTIVANHRAGPVPLVGCSGVLASF